MSKQSFSLGATRVAEQISTLLSSVQSPSSQQPNTDQLLYRALCIAEALLNVSFRLMSKTTSNNSRHAAIDDLLPAVNLFSFCLFEIFNFCLLFFQKNKVLLPALKSPMSLKTKTLAVELIGKAATLSWPVKKKL